MVQSTSPVSQAISLKRLVADTIVEIDRLGYTRQNIRRDRPP